MSRRLARETALKILFQVDVGRIPVEEAIANTLATVDEGPEISGFASELARGAAGRLAEIDRLLSVFAVDWPVERMANIDRNILRLAVYELLLVPDVPASVTVNEAVELAKRYGDADSAKFVNGILGNLVRQLSGRRRGRREGSSAPGESPPAGPGDGTGR
ncbi:MAG TPA: transcription antitermination factor NusB [Firmicutes bacterium]|nr:transcription antitermination factor NusB [Bacillota bacterium]